MELNVLLAILAVIVLALIGIAVLSFVLVRHLSKVSRRRQKLLQSMQTLFDDPELRSLAERVPVFSSDDVLWIIAPDYPAEDRDAIVHMLREYRHEPGQPEPNRIWMDILKLGGGHTDQLRQHVEVAKRDFRDVIGFAE